MTRLCRVRRTFAIGILTILGIAARAWSMPAFGETFQLQQPDGSWLDVRIWGDEFYGVTESLDGFTLVRDPQNGYDCYAQLSADGNALISSGVPAGAAGRAALNIQPHLRIRPEASRAQAREARRLHAEHLAAVDRATGGGLRGLRSTTTGTVQGITLIVQFPDVSGTITPAQVSNFCNQVGYSANGNNGSVRDYFFAVSDGLLTYTNFVPTVYYTASHNRSYYTDETISYGVRAQQLITEALTSLNNSGFNFSQYDSDGDDRVDALNCFYAGNTVNNWAKGLWPHASGMSYCADGVCTNSYQITNMGSNLTLSTFCHENGHMLMGWPDLYDYDSDSAGAGRYCVMCNPASSTNPQEPCSYLKYTAGWVTPTVLTSPQVGLSLPAASTNACYKYNHPQRPGEYFIIENRQRTGRDSALPDDGLVIWHIDTGGDNSNQQGTPSSHFEAAVLQADGRRDLENNSNSGDSTDLFASPSFPQCTPATTPNTRWWSGADSGLSISSISTSSANMTFNFTDLRDCNGNGQADVAEIAGNPSLDCQGNGTLDACELTGNDCNANLRPDVCDLVNNDCNANQRPDECDLPDDDCNANLEPDECDAVSLFAALTEPADQRVCSSSQASFTVQGPAGSSYRWYRGQSLLSNGAQISGATSSTLTISGTTSGDIGEYSCVVTRDCISARSAAATLGIVSSTLSAAQQPVVLSELCATSGQSAVFEFHANDEQNISYAWFKDGSSLTDDGRIMGSRTSRVLIGHATAADTGTYTCRAENTCGGWVESDPARGNLAVVGASFESQPQPTCTTVGGAARFQSRVDASANTLYFWYRNGELLSNGTDAGGMVILGADSPTLKLANVPAAYNGQSLQLVTFVSSPTCIGQSDSATLTVGGTCGPCRFAGDLDGDLDSDLKDMAAFTSCFGASATPGGPCECANIDNSNSAIDVDDWSSIELLLNGPS
jgi:M6 family metalloprotease-like protein